MLTLSEAITHCEEKAKELREKVDTHISNHKVVDVTDISQCLECAKEHEQLAEWLKELKHLREEKTVVETTVTKGGMTLSLYKPRQEISDLAKCIADVLQDMNVETLKNTVDVINFTDRNSGCKVCYRREDTQEDKE